MSDLAILAAYAHPDDEQGVTGTLARCAQEGIHTGLVCATRGEVGEIADPALATPETLGAVREEELRAAARRVGIEHVWFLDYRDSGMAGTPPNAAAEAFMNAEVHDVVGRLVAIIRRFRPQVIITFDTTGGYGHPDHLAINRWTTAAFHEAGDPTQFPEAGEAFTPARLFYSSFPRSAMQRMADLLGANDSSNPLRGADVSQMGLDDAQITNVVDVSDLVDLKQESLSYHATQMNPNSPFARVPAALMRSFRSKEHFALVAGTPLPAGGDQGDLFAGLR